MIRRFINKLLKKPTGQKKLIHGHALMAQKKSISALIESILSYFQRMLSK